MPVSRKNTPKINYDRQFKHITWKVKDGKIEKDEYVRANHNGKIRSKHTFGVIRPPSTSRATFLQNGMTRCKTLFPKRQTRRTIPKTKMLADVPELMVGLSPNVRNPKRVTFNPIPYENTSYPMTPQPITASRPALFTNVNDPVYSYNPSSLPNQSFPVSSRNDRMPEPYDVVFLDNVSSKRIHRTPTSTGRSFSAKDTKKRRKRSSSIKNTHQKIPKKGK